MNLPKLANGLTLLIKEIPSWGKREGRSERARESVLELLKSHLPEIQKLDHYPNGKPYLKNFPHLSLSISHSDKYAGILLTEGDKALGLDIEDRGRQVERVRHKFLDEAENDLMSRSGDELLALHLAWSAKESLYKALNPTEPYLQAFKVKALKLDQSEQTALINLSYQSKTFLIKAHYYSDYVLSYFIE